MPANWHPNAELLLVRIQWSELWLVKELSLNICPLLLYPVPNDLPININILESDMRNSTILCSSCLSLLSWRKSLKTGKKVNISMKCWTFCILQFLSAWRLSTDLNFPTILMSHFIYKYDVLSLNWKLIRQLKKTATKWHFLSLFSNKLWRLFEIKLS